MDPKAIRDRDRCRLLNPDIPPDLNQQWYHVKWFRGEVGRLQGHWVHRRRDLQILWQHGPVQRTCCNQIHGLFPLNEKKTAWKTVFLGNNDAEAEANIPDLSELYKSQLPPPTPSPQKWNRPKRLRSGLPAPSLLQSDRYNLRGWLLHCLKKDLDHLTYYDLLPFGNETSQRILSLLAFQCAQDRLLGKGFEGVSLGAKWQNLHHCLQPCCVCDRLVIIKTVEKTSYEDKYHASQEGREGEIISTGECFYYFFTFYYFFHYGS